jgi:hypothetical protein
MMRDSALRLASMGAAIGLAVVVVGASGCRGSRHTRVASFVAPTVPAGFIHQSGNGWRVAVPSTWKEAPQKDSAGWVVADPQPVDDFQASVNVLTEPFPGDSYEYAKASEAALRQDPRATVEAAREDVVDGDPTLVIESRWAPSSPSGVPYRTTQTAVASRGKGYVVTCAVAASAAERYRSTCDSIVHSFAVER